MSFKQSKWKVSPSLMYMLSMYSSFKQSKWKGLVAFYLGGMVWMCGFVYFWCVCGWFFFVCSVIVSSIFVISVMSFFSSFSFCFVVLSVSFASASSSVFARGFSLCSTISFISASIVCEGCVFGLYRYFLPCLVLVTIFSLDNMLRHVDTVDFE